VTTPTKRRPATDAEARALASALRLRVLRLCLDRALTNRELARLLDTNPATMLHHVRKLVDTGFLVPEPVRRGPRGSREVPYHATGKSWTLSVCEGQVSGARAMLDAYLQEIGLVDIEKTYLVRMGLRLTESDYAALVARLSEIFDEYQRRPEPPGKAYSLFLNVHPDVTRDAAG
jgi:hypothetical protein